MFLPLFIFGALLSSLSAVDTYVCNGAQNINPPTNISYPWAYPTTWDSSTDAPQYAANQNCTWTINVPKGMWAWLRLKANASNSAVLTVTDAMGYVTTLQAAEMEPFFMWTPSFKVGLQSTAIGTLGFKVQWFPVGTFAPSTVNIPANSSPVALDGGFMDNGTVITADTKVSILSIPPARMMTNLLPLMKATMVFDGPDINSTYRGNLYQVMTSGSNLVSTGRYLTLYSVWPLGGILNIIIAQDYNDVKQFKQYKGIQCYLPNICQVSLDASQGTAAAIRFTSDPFYVKQISMPQFNTLSVYNDYVTDFHKLSDYTSATAKTNIPQKFSGLFTTFVLNKDQATIQLSSDNFDAKWTTPFEGRRGFFASPNFGVSSINQTIHETISGNTFNVSYGVSPSALVDKSTLTVRIFDGSKADVDNTYTPSNVPAGTVYAKGNQITVDYNSPINKSPGAIVYFAFDKYNSARSYGLVGVVLMTIWMSLQ